MGFLQEIYTDLQQGVKQNIQPIRKFSDFSASDQVVSKQSHLALLIRWFTEQLYVAHTKTDIQGYEKNKSGGTTVSVKKRGGWKNAWADAQVLAGWATAPRS